MSVTPNPGKYPAPCMRHQPISLINCDTKVLAKALACRLEKVITLITHINRVRFIKSRPGSDSLGPFIDTIAMSQCTKKSSAVALLDAGDGEQLEKTPTLTRVAWLSLLLWALRE